ncbi:MAG: nitrate reductase [Bacteroidetes bacterium]|nr:MAG: nitrate reductase [Bacteroidota bacterium]
MSTSRRQFIKVSALGAGGVAVATSAYGFSDGFMSLFEERDNSPKKFKRTPTYCEVCFWKCAAWTHVDEQGSVVKLIGNDDDPQCNGRLCPRGTGGVGMYNDTDRLKTPLIRVAGVDGQLDTFRKATWEEALDLVAFKMNEIKEKYGPESFSLLKHGSSGSHFEHLFKAYGSDTIGEPAYAQCRGPRETGFSTTFGNWVGSPEPTDIRDTKCMVMIGSHIGENMHNTQVQELADSIDNDVTLITVDPRASTVASKSKYWLPIKPATDMALLLAWMNVIIYEELYDKAYIEKYTLGFEELKEHVRGFTPEWAYGITTIEPEIIRKTAREMGQAAPAVIIHPGRHVTWYGDDSQRERAMAMLNGLLGSWGKRGGFYLKEKLKIPKFPHPPYPHPKWGWEELGEKFPLAQMGLTNEIINASIPDRAGEHEVKAWFISGTNLINTIPDTYLTEQALDSLEFVVVCDTMPMEITGYADVILPECTYLERYDTIRSMTGREPSIALRMPAVKPKYDSKPSWWMAKQIGERLGLGAYFDYNDFADVLDWQLQQVGSSLEEMQRIGVKKYPRTSGPLYFENGEDFEFGTSSGKIELYSAELEELGFDPMPKFTAHPEPEDGFYRLIYGRAPMHTFSRTSNNPNLSDLKDENKVWVNPRVAKLWDLKNDQEVFLENQDGVVSQFPIKVRITERIRWDSVYMVHGFGHNNKNLTRAHGRGASDTRLITNVMMDPQMGGTGMRGNFVTFITDKNLVES